MIALRVDETLEKEFSHAVECEGKNRSQVLRELMEEYLRKKRSTPADVFKSKFSYGIEQAVVTRPRMTKAELKSKVREAIIG